MARKYRLCNELPERSPTVSTDTDSPTICENKPSGNYCMPVPCAPNAIKSLLPHAFQDRIKAMKETPARLPEFMRTLFWDVEFASIDPEHHESFIIERALEYGDDDAIRWIVRELPGRAIADTVRSSRSLSRNTGRLWSLVLGIPEGGILCLSTRSRMTPKAFSAR